MSLEKYYGVALGDIRSALSPSSFTYLTSILGGQSGITSSFADGDDLTSVGTISERICTNWSGSESSGRISSLILDMSESSVQEGDGGGGFSCNYEEEDLSTERKVYSFNRDARREEEEEGSNDDTEMMTGRNGPGKNALTLTLPLGSLHKDHQNVIADKRHLNLSSLRRAGGISHTKDLCSHRYPVCARTILAAKTTGPIESSTRSTRSVSVIAEKGKTFTRKDPNSPYALLVGKISDAPKAPSKAKPRACVFGEIKKNKSKLPAGGVCNLSHPMSNPLYRVYHPKGYVKSEDELAREYIQQITEEFNAWLKSLEGDHVQLDTRVLAEILRDQLQLPSITSTIIPSSPKSSEGSLLQGQ